MDFEGITTAEQARDAAIEWQANFSQRSMSWGELHEKQGQLEELAERFDLVEEFHENGII